MCKHLVKLADCNLHTNRMLAFGKLKPRLHTVGCHSKVFICSAVRKRNGFALAERQLAVNGYHTYAVKRIICILTVFDTYPVKSVLRHSYLPFKILPHRAPVAAAYYIQVFYIRTARAYCSRRRIVGRIKRSIRLIFGILALDINRLASVLRKSICLFNVLIL